MTLELLQQSGQKRAGGVVRIGSVVVVMMA